MFLSKRITPLLSLLLLFGAMMPVSAQESADALDITTAEEAREILTEAPIEEETGELMQELRPVKYDATFFYARVEEVTSTEEQIVLGDPAFIALLGDNQKRIRQEVQVRYLDGPEAGERATLINNFENQPRDLLLKVGDKVIVQQNLIDGEISDTFIIDYSRTTQTWIYIVLFMLAVLIYGGRQGVSSVLGFIATFAILFLMFIPGIMAGWNPVFLAVVCSVLITFLVHFFVGGLSAKSISSTIGTAGGTIIAGLIGAGAAYFAHLSGLSSEDARNLFVSVPTYDFNGIFLASIIIGSLGAVMDVGISIGSAMKEVKEVSPDADFWQLYRAGVTVGKDVLGTMSNTLILAYIGTGLPLILLLYSYNNMAMAFDYDFIVDEIVRSIAGSIGLLTAIPITAYFSALFEYRATQAKNSSSSR